MKTLDDYLEEIDRWKQAVSDRLLALPVERWSEIDREGRAWLEATLGKPLPEAPWLCNPREQEPAVPPPLPQAG